MGTSLNNKNSHLVVISVCYLLAHGLGLLNSGIFWDDWLWHSSTAAYVTKALTELGSPWGAVYFNYMVTLEHSILVFRTITFFSFYLSALALYSILKTIREISSDERMLITLFFAIFPCNLLRIATCISWYGICYFMFFLAFWLLKRHLVTGGIHYRLLALTTFFISFTTNSLLVFYILPLLYILYMRKLFSVQFRSLLAMIPRYLDFLLLPIVFWMIKKLFFPSYGFYQGYNSLSIGNMLLSPITAVAAFYQSLFPVMDSVLTFWPYPTSMILLILFIFWRMKKIDVQTDSNKQLVYSIVGLFCFYIAIFPYLTVGHIPSVSGFENRHQLLIPLGVSILLVYTVQFITCRFSWIVNKNQVIRMVYSIMVIQFLFFNIKSYVLIQGAWYKQLAIISQIQRNDIIRNHTTFLFQDHIPSLSAWIGRYGYLDYAAFMKKAFNEETRFGMTESEYHGKKDKRVANLMNKNWLLHDYQPKDPEYLVHIEAGASEANTKQIFQLLKLELTNKARFEQDVSRLIRLRTEKI